MTFGFTRLLLGLEIPQNRVIKSIRPLSLNPFLNIYKNRKSFDAEVFSIEFSAHDYSFANVLYQRKKR